MSRDAECEGRSRQDEAFQSRRDFHLIGQSKAKDRHERAEDGVRVSLPDLAVPMASMGSEMKQLQGAQLRLENQQQAMQAKMHQMEMALTAKLDTLLAALQSPDAPADFGGGSDCAAREHEAGLASVPEPETFAAKELEQEGAAAGGSAVEGDGKVTNGGDGDGDHPAASAVCRQTDGMVAANEGVPVCSSSDATAEGTAADAKKTPTQRVKLADMPHNTPAKPMFDSQVCSGAPS